MTTGYSGKHATYEPLKPRQMHPAEALNALISAARHYKDSREACPIGDWRDRYEEAGWKLAQAVRAYDKATGAP